MGTFTSGRERRLWLWTLAVVVAIYSTLGLAGTLTDELVERELLDSAFVVGFLLVLVTIASQGFTVRPRGLEIGIAVGTLAVYLMVFVRMGIPLEERTHLIEYGVVGVFVYAALNERQKAGGAVRAPALLAVAIALAIGIVDELIQGALPNRVFDPRDILFNAIAATMAVASGFTLRLVRRRLRTRRE